MERGRRAGGAVAGEDEEAEERERRRAGGGRRQEKGFAGARRRRRKAAAAREMGGDKVGKRVAAISSRLRSGDSPATAGPRRDLKLGDGLCARAAVGTQAQAQVN